MKRKWRRSAFCALVALLAASASAGQEPSSGKTDKSGQKVEDAIRGIKKGVQDASESVREQFARARVAVHNMGIEARIYGRLHWDKALTNAQIDLDVRNGGIATLRGVVADTSARVKAVALTRDTVGVTQVIDEMTVSTASSPGAADTPKTPPR